MATQISINLPKHPRKTVAIPFKPTHSPLIQLMINYILAYSRVQSTRHSSQFSKQLIQSVSLRSTRVNPNPLRKMEQIVQELHITDQAIKPKQHCACDLKRQQWHNAGLLVGWLNREWAKTWICSSAALCEKTANVWSRLECLNRWKRTFSANPHHLKAALPYLAGPRAGSSTYIHANKYPHISHVKPLLSNSPSLQ